MAVNILHFEKIKNIPITLKKRRRTYKKKVALPPHFEKMAQNLPNVGEVKEVAENILHFQEVAENIPYFEEDPSLRK